MTRGMGCRHCHNFPCRDWHRLRPDWRETPAKRPARKLGTPPHYLFSLSLTACHPFLCIRHHCPYTITATLFACSCALVLLSFLPHGPCSFPPFGYPYKANDHPVPPLCVSPSPVESTAASPPTHPPFSFVSWTVFPRSRKDLPFHSQGTKSQTHDLFA